MRLLIGDVDFRGVGLGLVEGEGKQANQGLESFSAFRARANELAMHCLGVPGSFLA